MKTKHLFLTAILLVFSMLVVAEPVDPMRALEVAEQFAPQSAKTKRIKSKTTPEQSYEIVYTHRMPNSDRAAFYVVKLGENGFVIISADDVANPILGYSYTNSWPTSISEKGDTLLPPQVLSYLNDMALQIETAIKKYPNLESSEEWNNVGQTTVRKSRARKSANALPDSVGPLLTTTWGQGQYYNALCPEDAGGEDGHVPTGCVATAMAQIINYWGQKEEIKTRGIHSYDSQYGNLRVNYDSTFYDFSNMPDALTAESTPEQVNAVAKLMYECGVAVNMLYDSIESAAYASDARSGLINFFTYNSNLSYAQKMYYSNSEWDIMIKDDINAGSPIYINNTVHAFICDGYKMDGYYHFNFGWGGASDGWYLMSAVNDDGGIAYMSSFGAILGIAPENTGNIIIGQTDGTSIFTIDSPMFFYSSMGNNKYVSTKYTNSCYNKVIFSRQDKFENIVIDVVKYRGQQLYINGKEIANSYPVDLSPIPIGGTSVEIFYNGEMNNDGFSIYIRTENDCAIPTVDYQIDTTSFRVENINFEVGDLWQIEYGEEGFTQGNGTLQNVNTSNIVIDNLSKYTSYDVYVRTNCGNGIYSPWIKNNVVLNPYWTDIVTTQPEGYIEDANGNIEISSVEGLAWLSVLINGLHGHQPNNFKEKKVSLIADLNLNGYRWYPMGRYLNLEWTEFSGIFDGRGHSIYNIYVSDAGSNLGLFGNIRKAVIRNINMEGGSVSSTCEPIGDDPQYWLPSSTIGGLIGEASSCYEISNCHSSVNVAGNGGAGSLCGSIKSYEDNIKTSVFNCSSTGTVSGREACGGLIGMVYGDVEIRNCYATGDVFITVCDFDAWEMGRGGLVGSIRQNSSMYNCYSIGSVINDSNYTETKGNLIGYIDQGAHIHYLYGQDNINSELNLVGLCPNCSFDVIMSDTSLFSHNQRTNTLLSPVSIDSTTYNDLLDALNAWVVLQNNPNYKTWTINNNTGYPTFGDNYVPSCYNPTDVTISNATIVGEETIRTQLSWHQEGEPIAWEILYVDTEQKIENGTIIEVNTNPCILSDIPVGRPLDFYVRAVCSDNDMSSWSEPITYIPDKLHWTEVVTAQPVGYTEDEEGNVFISSAEGLAWLSSVVNHLNGAQSKDFWSKTVYLLNDIDVSEYRWTPIGNSWENSFTGGTFDGKQHKIIGLYCNELSDNMGLFGCATNGCIKNISILHCNVLGENKIGAIVGWTSSDIINCSVEGNVYGIDNVGGLVGKHDSGDIITIANSFYIGEVAARRDITKANTQVGYVGGICGVVFNDSIVNCYVVSQITDDGFCSGIITGTGSAPIAVKNCYYKDYNTNLLVTSDNCIRSDNSSFTGSGISWILNTPPYVNGAFRTDLVDALNAWVDAHNLDGQYCHWETDTAGVNGGFPIFAAEDTKYIITFCNEDGTILQQDALEFGEMPQYRGEIPTKDSTEQYNYTFSGWDQEVVPVVEDITYTAQYESTINQYEINFYDWDGTLLQSSMVNYGEWPTYYNSDPWRAADAQYTYTFIGWSPELSMVTGTTYYYAQYETTLNQYEINFYDWDGTLLQSSMVNYGEWPNYYNSDPWREADAQYTYTFTGWSPELSMVTGTTYYYAQYETTLNQYEINFYDWDGTLLQSNMLNYGEMPEYLGATPTKPEDEQYIYTFLGWEPEITLVIDNATYSAVYEAIEKVGSFIENITTDIIKPRKVYIQGNLYIIIGDHIYSCQGHRIK